jgi:hypothetical protein
VVATIPLHARPSAIASDGESIWISGYNESTVFRIDPRTNGRVGRKVSVGAGPTLMTREGRSVGRLHHVRCGLTHRLLTRSSIPQPIRLLGPSSDPAHAEKSC